VAVLFACQAGCGSTQNAPITSRAARPGGAREAASPSPETFADKAEDSLPDDFADPFILRGPSAYYAFATGIEPIHLQVARSEDLSVWTHLGEALPELPRWALEAQGLTWAPSALARHDRYILYYTTRDASSGFQCISRALSSRPEGPYYDDSSEPLVCQVRGSTRYCGSIDPSPFVDADGKPYLLWKSDENSLQCRTGPRIWMQALTDDGLNLVGAAAPLLGVDQRWEDTIIEAPSMVLHGGRYFLFYSGNRYESGEYAIGYATCSRLFGVCRKATVGSPLLMNEGMMSGPGGQELFQDGAGDFWMTYHAWTSPKTTYGDGGARSLKLARVTFSSEETPRPVIRGR
jgi:beta-xylosidase